MRFYTDTTITTYKNLFSGADEEPCQISKMELFIKYFTTEPC